MSDFFRASALIAAVWLTGCGSGGLFGAHGGGGCGGGNADISDPGSFSLYVDGPGEEAEVDNLNGDAHGLTEGNSCDGIAQVDFRYSAVASAGTVDVTPLAVGQCTITFSSSRECVTDNVTVHPGSGLPSALRRGRSS